MWEKMKLMFSGIWSFVLPFLRELASDAGPILAKAALAAVRVVASNYQGKTSAEKRDAAFSIIRADLQQQGIIIGMDVGTSLVNAAIEVAYQKFQEAGK